MRHLKKNFSPENVSAGPSVALDVHDSKTHGCHVDMCSRDPVRPACWDTAVRGPPVPKVRRRSDGRGRVTWPMTSRRARLRLGLVVRPLVDIGGVRPSTLHRRDRPSYVSCCTRAIDPTAIPLPLQLVRLYLRINSSHNVKTI